VLAATATTSRAAPRRQDRRGPEGSPLRRRGRGPRACSLRTGERCASPDAAAESSAVSGSPLVGRARARPPRWAGSDPKLKKKAGKEERGGIVRFEQSLRRRPSMKIDLEELKRLKAKATADALAQIPVEVNALTTVLTSNDDPVLGVLLRFHLLIEELLHRIIKAHVKQPQHLGKRKPRLDFFTKLGLVTAMEPRLGEETLEAVRRLNQLRNDCAHQHEKRIVLEDLDHIGQSFGGRYAELRADKTGNLKALAIYIFGEIYGPMITAALVAEHVAALNIELE